MKNATDIVRKLFAVLTCAALLVWCIMPSFTHAPVVLETIQEHLEMVESHGHSHGFEEDLFWAMHGHSHDVADHDHSQAYLAKTTRSEPFIATSQMRPLLASFDGPGRQFRIERPPRV